MPPPSLFQYGSECDYCDPHYFATGATHRSQNWCSRWNREPVLDDPRETAQGESLLAESLLTESLIEDVPIHGMCGVY